MQFNLAAAKGVVNQTEPKTQGHESSLHAHVFAI